MKKLQIGFGGVSRVRKLILQGLLGAAFIGFSYVAGAAIAVDTAGSAVQLLNSRPPANEWSTFSVAGASGAPENGGLAEMDTFVVTNVASVITAQVGNGTGTPAANATAQWSSGTGGDGFVQTRPTGNAVTLLMASLTNISGAPITHLDIIYQLTVRNTAVVSTNELFQGHVLYYSLTGAASSWVRIGNFGLNQPVNSVQSLNIPVDLSATPWAANTTAFVLWADDNSGPNEDAANGIDNVRFGTGVVVPCRSVGVAPGGQPASVVATEGASASFSVTATGSLPIAYQWFKGSTAIGGATASNYTIARLTLGDAGQYHVVISNDCPSTATSANATLTVNPDMTAPRLLIAYALDEADALNDFAIAVFSEPMETNSVTDTSGYHFENINNSGDQIFPYEIIRTNLTNILIRFQPRTPGENYKLVIDNANIITDDSSQLNPLCPSFGCTVETALQQFGSPQLTDDGAHPWKVLQTTNDLTATAWKTAGYDDSSWSNTVNGASGPTLEANTAGLTIYSDTTNVLKTPNAANGLVSYWRTHFTYNGSSNAVLHFLTVFDDGGVIYLNGVEVARIFMPTGPIDYNTFATPPTTTEPLGGLSVDTIVFNLINGDNVLSVEMHQNGTGSSDTQMALRMQASTPILASGPPVFTVQPVSATINEGQSRTFTVSATGAEPITYQWRSNGVDLVGITGTTFTVSNATPVHVADYSVFASNSAGNNTTTNAHLTVIADTTKPTVVSVIGTTNATIIQVSFSRVVTQATAENTANYVVHLTAGGGNLTIVSAVLTNGTNVILTTSARTANQSYTIDISGVRDTTFTGNLMNPASLAVPQQVMLLPFTANWKYDQTGSDLGTAWKEIIYNDSGWLSGPGVLGFETTSNTLFFLRSIAPPNGTNTVLTLTNGGGTTNVTFYFRTTVNIPFDPSAVTIAARAYVDDGMILYVNGTERLRYNMTNGPGYLNFANAALTEPNPAPQTTFISSNLTGLVAGDNVIAVEVHQDALGSSDIDFGLELQALVTTFTTNAPPPGPLRVARNDAGQKVTLTWPGGGTLQRASKLALPPSATIWTDITGATSGFMTNYGSAPLYFRLRN